jgi:hypothetical protein
MLIVQRRGRQPEVAQTGTVGDTYHPMEFGAPL